MVAGGYQAGSAEERKKHISFYNSSVEDEMLMSGHNHSGKLFVSNQKTGVHYEIDTGEADSEVVWADDDHVLYRVNDQLLEARVDGGKLLRAAILASGDEVVQVHWVFRE